MQPFADHRDIGLIQIILGIIGQIDHRLARIDRLPGAVQIMLRFPGGNIEQLIILAAFGTAHIKGIAGALFAHAAVHPAAVDFQGLIRYMEIIFILFAAVYRQHPFPRLSLGKISINRRERIVKGKAAKNRENRKNVYIFSQFHLWSEWTRAYIINI